MIPHRTWQQSRNSVAARLSRVGVVVLLVGSSAPAMAEDALPYRKALPTPAPPTEPSDPDRPPPLLDEQLQAVPILGPTYLGAETKVTSLIGTAGVLIGGQAGWVAEPDLMIGFAGYGLISGTPVPEHNGGPASLQLAYGGAALVVRGPSEVPVPSDLVGARRPGVGTAGRDPGTGAMAQRSSPVLFALEPEVEAEMNVSAGVRLAASVSYRYLANPQIPGLDSAAVSGVAGGLAVKVGTF